MKNKLRITAIITAVFMLLAVCTGALASFGGSDDFDSDFESNDGFGSSSDDPLDETENDGLGMGYLLALLALVIVIIVIINFRRGRMDRGLSRIDGRQGYDKELMPMDMYAEEVDPGFSVPAMEEKLSNLYIKLQEQWCALDLEPLKPYLTDELYNRTERQLDKIRRDALTPHIENAEVLGAELRGYYVSDGLDHIIAELSTKITTYSTDEAGEVVRGNPNIDKYMTYEWELVRASEGLTEHEAEPNTVNCPGCGAPVSVNKGGRCPYCDSVITLNERSWLLNNIKGLSQRAY